MIRNRVPNTLEDIVFQKFALEFTEFISDKKKYCKTKKLNWENTLNTWPIMFSELLLRNILSNPDLSTKTRVKALNFIINEKFIQFNFHFLVESKSSERKILKILYDKCPKMELLNLSAFHIRSKNRDLFENLLMKCTKLEAVRVKCRMSDCAIRDILLGEFLHPLDYEKNIRARSNQNLIRRTITNVNHFLIRKYRPEIRPRHELPLDKIVVLDLCRLFPELSCTEMLRLLPNLTSLGFYEKVGKAISYLTYYECKNLKLKYIRDQRTTLEVLDKICYHCPDLEQIRLTAPQPGTVEQLSVLKTINNVELLWFQVEELYKYLKNCGSQIRSMRLSRCMQVVNINIILASCPNLSYLVLSDLQIQYKVDMVKYPNMRHLLCGRLSTNHVLGLKPLLYNLTKLETLEFNDRSLTHEELEELVLKMGLWKNLKKLYLCGKYATNKHLTIKSIRLILNHCKNLEELRNVFHFTISPSELSQLNEELKNSANKCKLLKYSPKGYFF